MLTDEMLALFALGGLVTFVRVAKTPTIQLFFEAPANFILKQMTLP